MLVYVKVLVRHSSKEGKLDKIQALTESLHSGNDSQLPRYVLQDPRLHHATIVRKYAIRIHDFRSRRIVVDTKSSLYPSGRAS